MTTTTEYEPYVPAPKSAATLRIRERLAREDAARGTTALAVRQPASVTWMPEPEAVNGAELLGHLAGYFGTYIMFPAVGAHVATTLWNTAALARNRDDSGLGPPIWRALPLLSPTSKDNKSGKSTVLDLTRHVQQVQRPVKITGRALAHKLGRKHEAVVLDEVKLLFGAGGAARDVQGVLLASYTPGGTWSYSRGNADVDIPCFGPVAYAAKDELITATGEQLIDLFDRTIFIRMRRPSRLMPQPDERAEDDGKLLGQSLIEWTNSVRDRLKARSRELADLDYEASQAAVEDQRGIDARRPQIWRPLLAVADVAGGPWPALARQAMSELTAGAATLEAPARMGEIRTRAQRWAPVPFLATGAVQAGDEDEFDEEDES